MTSPAKGFTIIELVLVFAISGVILLFSLMAIPSVQRNSRNNARKQDVTAALTAISKWTLNHSGALPTAADVHAGPNGLLQYTRFSIYERNSGPNGINIIPVAPSDLSGKGPNNSIAMVEIYNYQRCDPNSVGRSTGNGAGYRDVVALFSLQSRTGSSPQCQQL